jgi:flagellin
MRINNNITAINTHRMYGINAGNLGRNVERLSSGFRVNRAADDAAGLAISEKMRAQIRGLNQASRNSQDGVSLVQTAEGGLQTIQNIVQRVRELAIQSGADTNTDDDRAALQLEVNQLLTEIDQIVDTTEFNTMRLLNGSFAASGTPGPLNIQVGANQGQVMTIAIRAMSAAILFESDGALGGAGQVSIGGAGVSARGGIDRIQGALDEISMMRAELGAFQNRLEFKIQNLDNQSENLSAAESRIRDADMAQMMTEFTRNNVLFQASTAMLAQANALPQSVLQLLG